MQNKLQELTDKLYKEGLSKGKEEGEAILASAKAQAEEILAKAKKEAEEILSKAEKDAAELKSKAEADIKMASSQSLQATKKDIENLLVGKITDSKVSDALANADYVKDIIKTVAQKFSSEGSSDLNLVLPESMKEALEPFVKGELASALSSKVEASFSKKIAGGFTIGPKDEGWFISLTDDSFKSLIAEYLRPVTKKFLFGE